MKRFTPSPAFTQSNKAHDKWDAWKNRMNCLRLQFFWSVFFWLARFNLLTHGATEVSVQILQIRIMEHMIFSRSMPLTMCLVT
jgi:hypothetical protein